MVAWLVAVCNNFILNRHWTFDARDGRARFQAVRFLLVSLVAEAFSLLLLTLLVEGAGLSKVPAQALAVGGVDAAELPRQQALELPRQALSGPLHGSTARGGRVLRTALSEPIL